MSRPPAQGLRVCMFSTVHNPDDVRVFHREARTLAAAGHRVVLLVHADGAKAVRQGVEIIGVKKPGRRWRRILNGWHFYRMARRLNAEVYHFHDFELLPWGWLLKKSGAARVIYDCHENHPETILERAWLPAWLKPALARLVAFIEPRLARPLDAVLCVVPDQQQRLQRAGCRTLLVRNYPRLELFVRPAPSRQEAEIIYLGGLSVARGARLLVDIMQALRQRHPRIRLLCLGPFNEPEVERKVRAYARQRQVDGCMAFLPRVAHEQVAGFLHRARVGLIPWQPVPQMLKMCYPNKVFEYMACGLPVVASDLPGLRQLIEPAQCGILVRAEEAPAHAAAIATLLDDPDAAREMGERGRVFAQAHYAWRQEANVLLDCYEAMRR